ncbi:MAG: response regulator [Limnochordaceae bacterium]|nr:response regulator [Limnochordaceae bacterium]
MGARIMVVDDTAFMRLTLRKLLEKAGHQVVAEAENGAEALERYAQVHPDLVTLDLVMPVMDGIATLKELTRRDPGCRVIVCSSMGQKALVVEALNAGAYDFIVKPFQPQRVLEAVARAVAARV